MSDITPEDLDRLFPGRHEIAASINLHPSLWDGFVPLPTAPLTPEQREALFPSARRVPVMRELVQSLPLKVAAS